MNRTTLAAITLVSALATPVVVNAMASKTAPVVAGAVVAAPKVQDVQEPTCVRQIKVVYAGYGEAKAVPCTTLVRHFSERDEHSLERV